MIGAGFWVWLLTGGWRTVALVLAVLFAALAVYALAVRQDYIVVTEGRAADARVFKAEIAQRDLVIQTYRQQEQSWAAIQRQRNKALEDARAASAPAQAKAEAEKQTAEQGSTAFRKVYERRPESCQAALEALEAACPQLADY